MHVIFPAGTNLYHEAGLLAVAEMATRQYANDDNSSTGHFVF